jgi:peptidyl-prolyl cis-trans isomerase C
MKKLTSLAVLLAAAGSLPALAQPVAVVNGIAIEQSELDNAVKQVEAGSGGKVQDTPALRENLKQSLIGRKLLLQEAGKRGLADTPAFKERLEALRSDLLLAALENDELKKHPVTDAAIKATYDKQAAVLKGGKEVRVRHMVVKSEAEAKSLSAQLKKGASFAELAKAHSVLPDGKQAGGDMGWGNLAAMPPQLASLLKPLGKGQISEPVSAGNGAFALFKVEDIRTAVVPPFEQVKPEIARDLRQRALTQLEQDLRGKAKIQ